jgi:hypothetical protein
VPRACEHIFGDESARGYSPVVSALPQLVVRGETEAGGLAGVGYKGGAVDIRVVL